MPLYFWNDTDDVKYRSTYFNTYDGVWRHGDWVKFHSDTEGITFLGRSDFVLKPSGVRIGPAEIYNVVNQLKEVFDCLVIGQKWKGDQRIVLFVKLTKGVKLTSKLEDKIRLILKVEASPRHVPSLILQVPDIPYTYSMKRVESSVSNIFNGIPITNKDALINPSALVFFERISKRIIEDKV